MRNHFIKLFGVFIILLTVLGTLNGCGQKTEKTFLEQEGKWKKVIGLSLYYRQDEYYKDTEAAFVEEATKRGYEIIIKDANADITMQIQHLEDFIAKKVDLILMAAVEPYKIIPTIELANKAGIPVFAYDEPPKGGKIASSIIWDNYKAGEMIGEWAKEYIIKNLNGKAEIFVLDLPSQFLCMERVKGFTEVVSKLPEVSIIANQDCKADRASSMLLTENILNKHKDLDLILGVIDDAAFGAIAAIEAEGRDVVVLSAGSWSIEAMRHLSQGGKYYKANVIISPYEQAKVVFDEIDNYFKGKNVSEMKEITIKIYDKDNIKELDWRALEEKRRR